MSNVIRFGVDHGPKCSCGHYVSMHRVVAPYACRHKDCECEGWFKLSEKDRAALQENL